MYVLSTISHFLPIHLCINYTSKMAAMWAADIRLDSYEQLAGKSSIVSSSFQQKMVASNIIKYSAVITSSKRANKQSNNINKH